VQRLFTPDLLTARCRTDRTVGIGDWVQAGSMIGRINEIKWRSTSLRTEDGDLVIVSTSRLLDTEVQNLSWPDEVHRTWVKVGFHYCHPPNEVKGILLDAIHDTPGVRPTPTPDCILLYLPGNLRSRAANTVGCQRSPAH